MTPEYFQKLRTILKEFTKYKRYFSKKPKNKTEQTYNFIDYCHLQGIDPRKILNEWFGPVKIDKKER